MLAAIGSMPDCLIIAVSSQAISDDSENDVPLGREEDFAPFISPMKLHIT